MRGRERERSQSSTLVHLVLCIKLGPPKTSRAIGHCSKLLLSTDPQHDPKATVSAVQLGGIKALSYTGSLGPFQLPRTPCLLQGSLQISAEGLRPTILSPIIASVALGSKPALTYSELCSWLRRHTSELDIIIMEKKAAPQRDPAEHTQYQLGCCELSLERRSKGGFGGHKSTVTERIYSLLNCCKTENCARVLDENLPFVSVLFVSKLHLKCEVMCEILSAEVFHTFRNHLVATIASTTRTASLQKSEPWGNFKDWWTEDGYLETWWRQHTR